MTDPAWTIAEIRHASPDYWAAVALRNTVLRKPLGLAFSRQELDAEGDSWHIVATGTGRLVGCLVLRPAGEATVQMRQVAVAPDLQGQGLGTALVAWAERLAQTRGVRRIVLHARETAVPFYQRRGYAVVGERFFEVTLPHWSMEKRLEAGCGGSGGGENGAMGGRYPLSMGYVRAAWASGGWASWVMDPRRITILPIMATVHEALSIAVQYHRAGQFEAARQIYQQVLAVAPDASQAWHMLGVILHQQGQDQAAVTHIRRAIELGESGHGVYSNLGEAYRGLKDFPQAIASFQRGLELAPEAAEIHYNLGNAYKDSQQYPQAIACYRRAVELRPDHAQAYNNLGNVFKSLRRTAEAIACLQQALRIQPELFEAHNNLGLAWQQQGDLDAAIACFRRALQLYPDRMGALCNLGNALREKGLPDEAIASFRRAIAQQPDFVEPYYSLAFALQAEGHLDEAAACCRQALALRPDYAEAYNNLGVILRDQGLVPESLDCFRRAVELKPEHAEAFSNLVFTLHYREGITNAELAAAHDDFQRRRAAPLRAEWPAAGIRVATPSGRRLRVGFLSADFRHHPVSAFLVGAFERLARDDFEIACYYNGKKQDDRTDRFRARTDLWREITSVADAEVTEIVRADRLDVLIDLAGHTAYNRMLVIARKPAPAQATWIGYEGTTGLEAMDYLLADRHVLPTGYEAHCRERILLFPGGYVCYEPLADAPTVGPSPLAAHGWATFGSMSNLAKLTPQVVATWSRILRQVPQAKLLLKYRGLADPVVCDRYRQAFGRHGVSPDRLLLAGPDPYGAHLAAYQQVDVALDPFPFNGSITTCESLWMGVPVVTCPGQTFASRHSLSHLASLGMQETVAADLDDYVAKAVELAGDCARLTALRGTLRDRMAAAPLCNPARLAAELTALLQQMGAHCRRA